MKKSKIQLSDLKVKSFTTDTKALPKGGFNQSFPNICIDPPSYPLRCTWPGQGLCSDVLVCL